MKEKEFVNQTLDHIREVQKNINLIINELLKRSSLHDKSKLQEPEYEGFWKNTSKLKGLTFGSDDYKQTLQDMAPTIQHHYSNNSHHPENHKNGLNDMDLCEIIEMLCDWLAATKRHSDGDIWKSLDIQEKKLGMSKELKNILSNTVKKCL